MSDTKKVAIVTGASRGIGAGLVEGFLSRGFRMVANARDVEAVAGREPDVVAVGGDIADPHTAQRVVEAALRAFGRVDTLVNNAGIFVSKPFVDYSPEDFARVMSVNVAGFFYVTQHAIRAMLQRGAGHVVQITTSLVEQPIKGVPAALASLSKGGLASVTRSLAIEYADRGIRVNAVSPGIIATPMHAGEDLASLAALHPMGRVGTIAEVVDAALYLESAEFVTGETLHVDGGQHAGRW